MATTTTTLSDEATKAVDAIEETTRGAHSNIADAADAVRTAANEVAVRVPDAAATTRSRHRRGRSPAQERLGRDAERRHDADLGLAIGLLIGGANRLLVAAALVPVAAMGLTLLGRTAARTGPGEG